jgi:hypothetical protein
MSQCTPIQAQLQLDFHPEVPVVVTFDAPESSSDGGALLLRHVDDRIGLSHRLAGLVPDPRSPKKVLHSRQEQLRQRIYQIALGYEDCDDADWLRRDPVLLSACDRRPSDEAGLSSQPTLSRLENGISMMVVRRLERSLIDSYVAGLPVDSTAVILDIDATDDETHGGQQLSFFHGFYDHHMYHPLMVFDGADGQLVASRLRPGNTHASRGAVGLLRYIIRKLKQRFPELAILVRGDAGFSVPKVMNVLERLNAELHDVYYLLGLAKNAVLQRRAAPTMAAAKIEFECTGQTSRHFAEFEYAAETWPHLRRVIVKAEHMAFGPNPRFVVTNLVEASPAALYHGYCQRGAAENFIKDFKNALAADRLSCSSFAANAFRLVLHAAAYRLMHALRSQLTTTAPALAKAQFDTLRLRLLKVAALVSESTRRILIRLPRVFPCAAAFRATALALAPAPG